MTQRQSRKSLSPVRRLAPIDREFNKLRIVHDIDLMARAERTTIEQRDLLTQQAANLRAGIADLERMLADLNDVDFIEELAGGPASVIGGIH